MTNYNVAAIISGRGSTFMAFYEACQKGLLPGVNPALLISTTSQAKGLNRARDAGFPAHNIEVFGRSKFLSPDHRGMAIVNACRARDVQLIVLMGALLIVTENVHQEITTLNQHPARIPAFGGLHGLNVHQAVINYVRAINRPFVTEPTVHVVTNKLDDGPVAGFRRVPVYPADTPESLDERVIGVEHELVQTSIYMFSRGKVGYFEYTRPLAEEPGDEQKLATAIAEAKAASEKE